MRILKVEKSNCGWFVRYEHLDWGLLLVALLMESIWVYGITMPFNDKFAGGGIWFRALIMITFIGSCLMALFTPLALIITYDHADWFVTKEKFVKKIKIMVDNQYVS